MTADDIVGLILSVVILAYLVSSLVFPERLG